MFIQNLDNKTVMIKHETVIDADDVFILGRLDSLNDGKESYDDYSAFDNDEQILFDKFIKDKLRKKFIAIQLFEVINKNISFGEYFAPEQIWENSKVWNEWSDKFKSNHTIFIYFYKPEISQKEIFNGSIHMDPTTRICFTNNNSENIDEYFKIDSKDYFINHNDMTGTFELELLSDVIWKNLQKSKHVVCQNLVKEFIHTKLQNQLLITSNTLTKNKI